MAQKYTLSFDAQMTTNNIRTSIKELQNSLNGIHLPKGIDKSLASEIGKLETKIEQFQAKASKGITNKQDYSALQRNANSILLAYEKIKNKVKEVTNASGKDLQKLLPEAFLDNYDKAQKALKDYNAELKKVQRELTNTAKRQQDLRSSLEKVQNRKVISDEEYKSIKPQINELEQQLKVYAEKRAEIEAAMEKTQQWYNSRGKDISTSPKYEKEKKELEEIIKLIEQAEIKKAELNNLKTNSVSETGQANAIKALTEKIDDSTGKMKELIEKERQLGEGTGLEKLATNIQKITGIKLDGPVKDIDQLREAVQSHLNTALQELNLKLITVSGNLDKTGKATSELGNELEKDSELFKESDRKLSDVQGLKSRIEYFFGLQNAIQLVKKAMRDAYQTVKDLDKVMTETAVVTDFSVGDMWAQLPDYTRRANELGVSTQAAYEAATLYYQQGLKTNEVTALSNETLKMARIAGLEAADATDRKLLSYAA